MKKQLLIAILSIFFSINASAQLPTSARKVKPILVGDKIPDTQIVTSEGNEVSTKKLFNKKQTVLVIYRGGWCPFCSRQLEGLGRIKDELLDLNYQIVAVSPDSRSSKDSKKYARDYIIGSDSSTKLIRNLGIAYKAPKKYTSILRKASNGRNIDVIPAPSVFILNGDGEILFEHVSTNFRKRISSDILLAVAEGYKE